MQDNINKIKQIIVEDFEARSKKYGVALSYMNYLFQLKPVENKGIVNKVTWNKQEIEIVEDAKSIGFIAKALVKQKVNHCITKALLSFAVKYKIEKGKVNVIMTIDDKSELELLLRNALTPVKTISVEELIGI